MRIFRSSQTFIGRPWYVLQQACLPCVQDQARSQVGTQLGSLLSYEGQGRGHGVPEVSKLLVTAGTHINYIKPTTLRHGDRRSTRTSKAIFASTHQSCCTQDVEASDAHQAPLLSQLTSDQPADSSAPESASALTQSEVHDNGWGEHADWDFQDVPLDSPRSSNRSAKSSLRSPAKSQTAKAQQPADQQSAPKHEFHDHSGSSISAKEVAALQRENDTLTRRLKHVEGVRITQPSTGHKTNACICHCFMCTMPYHCMYHRIQSMVQ